MLFACLTAPTAGGATGVADSPAVLDALPADAGRRGSSARAGCSPAPTTTRSGRPFAEAFGTDDRAAVERYCRANAIEFEWQPDGGLRTRQRRSAVVRHPVTGRRCWFNQIAFLNEWTLDPEVREYLVDVYGADGLPFNTRFGNGDPIGEDVVELLNEVYEAHTAREPWQAGDLLLVDNIRTAHSREPYEGPREVLVGDGRPGAPGRLRADREVTADDHVAHPADPRSRAVTAPPFAVISGAQVQQALQGREKADRRAGRGHLPAARRRRLGEPAVVLPALPGPADLPDHRAARLDRRATSGWTA